MVQTLDLKWDLNIPKEYNLEVLTFFSHQQQGFKRDGTGIEWDIRPTRTLSGVIHEYDHWLLIPKSWDISLYITMVISPLRTGTAPRSRNSHGITMRIHKM